MTRKRVTASERKQRHEWAVRHIDVGMGLSEFSAFSAETLGCSRRNARDVVAAAHKDWRDVCYGSEEIDQRDLLFQQVGRLERNDEGVSRLQTGRIPAGFDLDFLVDVAH